MIVLGVRARSALAVLVLTVATIASLLGLTVVVEPGPWVHTTVLMVGIVAGVVLVSRVILVTQQGALRSWTPTMLGAVAATWVVAARFGSPGGTFDPLVGGASLGRVLERLGSALQVANDSVAPAAPVLPLELALVASGIALFLLADALSAVAHRATWAGLPLIVLWVPPLVIEGHLPALTLWTTVTCLVVLLALAQAPAAATGSRTDPSERRARALRLTAVVGVGAAVAGVSMVAGAASARIPSIAPQTWADAFTARGEGVQLSDDLNMLRDLRERSSQPVLSYTVQPANAAPESLRVYTVSAFDGESWSRDDRGRGTEIASGDVLWPESTDDGAITTTLDVTLQGYRDETLPVVLEPRSLDADPRWRYHAGSDEIRADAPNDPRESYSMTVHGRDLSPELLRAASGPDPDQGVYTEVPQTSHTGDVADLAATVTKDTTTRYDAAIALQSYFRDPGNFAYKTTLPPRSSDDAVWDFLQSREGYCVQFATSMTVMARSLGIPARVGVGFLPGELTDGDRYTVTAQRSHAWPELYFPGSGWVRFEPTPAVQSGAPPRYAIATTSGSSITRPSDVPQGAAATGAASAGPQASATSSAAVADASTGVDGSHSWVRTWWAVGIAGAVVLAGALVLLASRRRVRPGPQDLEAVWRSMVVRLAREGVELPPHLTPRQVPLAFTEQVVAAHGGPPSPEALDALTQLTGEVEDQRYARTPAVVDLTRAEALADLVVADTTSRRRGRVPVAQA